MSLEQFRRTRMVILSRQSMAHQAARAMADDHIGAVLVNQPPARGISRIVIWRWRCLAATSTPRQRRWAR